ncbi:MAG: formate--tetrahydrofolate ligase [Solirubrobacteraceae bacterium]
MNDSTAPSAAAPKSDWEIANAAKLWPITRIAQERLGIPAEAIEPYGQTKAKIGMDFLRRTLTEKSPGKLVLVTAISPTPAGEGKTTTTVGLGDALNRIGKRTAICLREASLGPCFGMKGGAAGGGYSQVVPMDEINLHFTGDLHAITSANNLLAALIDNHIYWGNALRMDSRRVTWRRCMDMNDRALRSIVTSLGGATNGYPREAGFDITAASEVMAILGLTTSLQDLRQRLGRIAVGTTRSGTPVTAEDLHAAGAMTVLLRDAIKPNLLQTLEHTPALVHAGPFGNIATGTSSVLADLIGIRCGELLVTEAGFGADMGAERFFNIKCRASTLTPDAAVVVATVRALKAHSGAHRVVAGRPLPPALLAENPDEVAAGASNLRKQLENVLAHGVRPVVAINAFPTDFPSEHRVIAEVAAEVGAPAVVSTHFQEGGAGAAELAEAVDDVSRRPERFRHLYPDAMPLREKVGTVATRVYGAEGVDWSEDAARRIDQLEARGLGRLPICIAKSHLSLSADPRLVGAPTGWRLPVREVRASLGAGFVYLLCGTIPTMPGLGSHPAAERIDIDENGEVVGLA